MKVLVYGGKGWIGSQFCEGLDEAGIEYVLGKVRVDNTVALTEEIDTVAPTHVVSTIGRTSGVYEGSEIRSIDYLEKSGKLVENVRDNLYGPITLALLCSRRAIHLTYLGTGCIFEYDTDHTTGNGVGFTEEDRPNFLGSSYSVVKGFTDRLMHLFAGDVLNLRIRMPIVYEDHPKDFITKIKGYAKVCNMPNSMTVLPTFIPVWIDMLKNCKTGTYNCTNPGLISHNEILEIHRELVDPKFKWENFTIEEQDQVLLSKRSNNFLNTNLLEKEYPNIPNIVDAVRLSLLKRV